MAQMNELLKKSVTALRAEGFFFIFLGTIAILLPVVFSVSFVLVIGSILLVSGIFGLIRALSTKHVPGRMFSVLMYLVFVIAGLTFLLKPGAGMAMISMIVGWFFLVSGIFKFLIGLNVRPAKNWGWAVFDGVVNILFGGLLLSHLAAGALIIAIFVGIKMIFLGYSMLMLASGLKEGAES